MVHHTTLTRRIPSKIQLCLQCIHGYYVSLRNPPNKRVFGQQYYHYHVLYKQLESPIQLLEWLSQVAKWQWEKNTPFGSSVAPQLETIEWPTNINTLFCVKHAIKVHLKQVQVNLISIVEVSRSDKSCTISDQILDKINSKYLKGLNGIQKVK